LATPLTNTLLIAASLAVACALLSIVVVLCRWSFIGEGISHSGFGGAGTAWLLMLLIPSLDQPWVPYLSVVIFCLLTAIAIGALSRSRGMQADAAIGIFLVASLAWGFLCQQIFVQVRHATPTLFDALLFGQLAGFTGSTAVAAVMVCLAVSAVVIGLWNHILAYSFDPLLADSSGVRAGMIHYLLMILIALVIVIGSRLIGSVLVTALLILPAATALRISDRLSRVVMLSLGVALTGTLGGVLIDHRWPMIPAGPAVVLILFILFLLSLAYSSIRRPVV
jgi:ABC-type Mn2+/Zn2+ transport system permease subunit